MSSIIVANANADSAKKIAAVLKSSGLQVDGICTAGSQLMNVINRNYHGGIIISSIQLSDMLAVNLTKNMPSNFDFLFLLKPHQTDIAIDYPSLLMPLKRLHLISSVTMLLNLAQGSSLSLRKKILENKIDEKSMIKRAKELLMERNLLTEMQAHRFIQKKSMDTGKKTVETAMIILEMNN